MAATAHVCVFDHEAARKDGVSWSVRNKIDMVNKNTCPDMSCPLLSLGTVLHGNSGSTSGDANRLG